MMSRFGETDSAYWREYDGLQAAKHTILRRYLGGWYPILARWHGRIAYIDCHAGRGRHLTGQAGSPLLALQELLDHKMRQRILIRTEAVFLFFERDEHNACLLEAEIDNLRPLPPQVRVDVKCKDYDEELRTVIGSIRSGTRTIAPTFAFVDPYGFKISMGTLNDLLSFPRTEVLINFMYRYVDMAVSQDSQNANLDSLFGCRHWRGLRQITDPRERAKESIKLFGSRLMAQYVTRMHMLGSNNALKYVMLHATNHEAGRDLMKAAMWATAPDGSFSAFERDNPDQGVLLVAEPDLNPFEDALWTEFAGRSVQMRDVYNWLRGGSYLESHLHAVLRRNRKAGFVSFSGYAGRFAFSKDPHITFSLSRTRSS